MIKQSKFDDLRARILAKREKRDDLRRKIALRYGKFRIDWASKSEQRLWQRLCAAVDKDEEKMFDLLDDSPRNWRSGVPASWALTKLTYADAIKPTTEPLSVVPPCSYGNTHPIK